MPEINGVDFNNISEVSGTPKLAISELIGVPVSSGSSCTTVLLGFVDIRSNPPDSCRMEQFPYEFNEFEQFLYNSGDCGGKPAPMGYYSDGITIYSWDGQTWQKWGICKG